MSPLVIALIIGIFQGVVEWLPISSQGNLILIMTLLLGIEAYDALSLSVYIHLGTGLAALTYFGGDIWRDLRAVEKPRQLIRFLAMTTLVTGVVGLPLFLFAQIASVIYGEILLGLTGLGLIFTGLVEKRARRLRRCTVEKLSLEDGIILGIVQGLSAIPGISRSGVTTSALLVKGFSGEEALRVSFMMSIPTVFAAALGLMVIERSPLLRPNFLIALASAFLSALLSMGLLLRLSRRIKFWSFCIALGVIALIPLIPHLL